MNLNELLGWSEVLDARAQAQQQADEEFRQLMRSRYGIANFMAPEEDTDAP